MIVDLIDWHEKSSHILLNPLHDKILNDSACKFIKSIHSSSHVFLSTSGTTSCRNFGKIVALSKNAFLNSSMSVNQRFDINHSDVLLNILPTYHVGGLSLFSRAYLAKAKMISLWTRQYKWNPQAFVNICQMENVTITSLVPTQVFDLVKANQKAPPSLRFVFIGGAPLSREILMKALRLKWPLVLSYGMTETSSQFATFVPSFSLIEGKVLFPSIKESHESFSYPFSLYPHIQVKINEEQNICVQGSSLLSFYIECKEKDGIDHFDLYDPKSDGYFHSNDRGCLENDMLFLTGRTDDTVKIYGEKVCITELSEKFSLFLSNYNCGEILFNDFFIYYLEDARKGKNIYIIFSQKSEIYCSKIKECLLKFNQTILAYERIELLGFINEIPRTELGKVKRGIITDFVSARNLTLLMSIQS